MGRRRVKCKRAREVVDQRSGLRDVAGPVPPLPTVTYLVRVMLLGILSVRTIKEHTEMPVVKRFFFLSEGKKNGPREIWSYVLDERERVPSNSPHWSLVRKPERRSKTRDETYWLGTIEKGNGRSRCVKFSERQITFDGDVGYRSVVSFFFLLFLFLFFFCFGPSEGKDHEFRGTRGTVHRE